jgi:hypothetical protein
MHFPSVNGILLVGKSIQKWNHLLHASNFTLIAHTNVHYILFVKWEIQHDVVFQHHCAKSHCMVYCIQDVHECPCHLHMNSPKGDKLFSPFHIEPLLLH